MMTFIIRYFYLHIIYLAASFETDFLFWTKGSISSTTKREVIKIYYVVMSILYGEGKSSQQVHNYWIVKVVYKSTNYS